MAGMERFTARARRVLTLAHQEAEQTNFERIGTEHLLLGLMLEDGGVASRVLRDLGLEEDRVREVMTKISEQHPSFSGQIELGDDTQAVLEVCHRRSPPDGAPLYRYGTPFIGPGEREHGTSH